MYACLRLMRIAAAQGGNGRRLGAAKRATPGTDVLKSSSGLCKAAALDRFRCLLDLQCAATGGDCSSRSAGGANILPAIGSHGDANCGVSGVRLAAAHASGSALGGETVDATTPATGQARCLGEMVYGEAKAAAKGGVYAAAWRAMRQTAGGPFEHWISKPPELELFGARC